MHSNMYLLAITSIIAFFHTYSCKEYRNCTKEDYCLPVPASACDKSLCVPIAVEEWAAMGEAGLKPYTWNTGQAPFLGYCPFIFTFEKSQYGDYFKADTGIITISTGPYCNISTTTIYDYTAVETDPYTGKIKKLDRVQAGDLYEVCMTYFDPGVAFVYRTCRVNPPPENGQGCASFYAFEVASGNCNKDKFLYHLKSLGVDFPQVAVDCL